MLPVCDDKFFNVGELKMVQVYRKGYLSSMWTSADTYHEFCVKTIQLAIENLVVNKIISYSVGIIERDYLLFTTSNLAEYVTYNAAPFEDYIFGYLESKLLGYFLYNSDHPLESQIASLLDEMLPDGRYSNPGKEILQVILTQNKREYWDWRVRGNWFWKTFDISICPENEDSMVNDLNRISAQVIEARGSSREFRDFSSRVNDYINLKLRAKTDSR
jgi:hypothetical protein